jgi:hypothetical protein
MRHANSFDRLGGRSRLSRIFQTGTFALLVVVGLALIAVTPSVTGQPQPPPPPAAEATEQEGVETLTRGPIHEAFANPADLDPTPGPLVNKQPPADIREEPPEFMPEGAVWIPGYWLWSEERENFVWVTGVARKPPPGMRFVPGYWTEADGGWQRVSGFWVSADVPEVEYREPPPATLDTGPSSPAPADNYFWVPGTWMHYDTGYRWRAGYWAPYQPDWIWCPARWVWTPAGCIYTAGYWDYRLSFRGNIFAPIYFHQPIYTRPAWVYRPWCVIPTSNLFIHLWVRPTYSHYYFGDFYGPRYADWGFHPWCHFPVRRHYYDPLFVYSQIHYRRQGIDFVTRVQDWHDHYDRHEDRRPPRTWREQRELLVRAERDAGRDPTLETRILARNLEEVARRDDSPLRLTRLDDRTREMLRQRTERVRELDRERKRIEQEAAQVATRDAAKGKADDREKRGTLIERAEGTKAEGTAKTGRDAPDRDRAARTARLTLPKADLPVTADRTAARGRNGDDKADKSAGKSPGAKDRGTTARRDEVPPPIAGTDRTARDADRAGRDKDRTSRETDRAPRDAERTARDGKTQPGADRTLSTEDRGSRTDREGRLDRGPVAERTETRPSDRPADQPRQPRASDVPRTPQAAEQPRPRSAPDVDKAEKKGKSDADKADKKDKKGGPGRSDDRPERGQEAPKGKLPEAKALPDASTPRDARSELPEGRVETRRVDPRSELPESRVDTPQVDPRTVLPGRTPGSNFPGEPGTRLESPRNQPPRPTRGNESTRSEAVTPRERGDSPAPMPRVEPRQETRPMPRVEPPREARPMPRVDVPRETRPAPRIEVPKDTPRTAPKSESPRAAPERAPRVEPPRTAERAPRVDTPRTPERAPKVDPPRSSDSDPKSEKSDSKSDSKSDTPSGKGKGRDRDDD